jgi:undecaprenyl-phosphate 4-deoxy-4-formamido-L-arabinose transferase
LAEVVDEMLNGSPWIAKDIEVQIDEVILVHDHGPDDSAQVIRELAAREPRVHAVWLSRNFGQHGATLAGMAASTQEWIVTMDEDGQHDPAYVAPMVAAAVEEQASVVYGVPSNAPTHGALRNVASTSAKSLVSTVTGDQSIRLMQSYRLMLGELGRTVAAYAHATAYLDVVLGWMSSRTIGVSVVSRADDQRPSGYRPRRLLSHFWRLVLSSGTRPLRAVAALGGVVSMASITLAVFFLVARLSGADYPEGFASLIVVTLFGIGAVLVALGLIAEYLGTIVSAVLGRPAFVVMQDTQAGPLGRR